MATLTYNGESFAVDHAVKGVDYIHAYDANGVLVVAFDGVTDFARFTYSGTYMAPSDCLAEHCNTVRYCGGALKMLDGTPIPILDLIYPVGSIYMSANPASPAVLFGGTWKRIEDAFLLAAGESYAAGTTGGEAQHTLTVGELPSHNHDACSIGISSAGYSAEGYVTMRGVDEGNKGTTDTTQVSRVGGGQAHNNMPPYLAVYVWQRVADPDAPDNVEVPAYWNDAVNDTIATIRSLQADPDNVPLFAYFSDCHIRPNATTPNPGHTGALAAAVMNACCIPFAMCCGDTARSDGNGLTEESQMADCFTAANENFAPIGWDRLLQTQGNHDGSWGTANGKAYAYQMSPAQLYDHIYSKQKAAGNHVFGGGDNSYFYVDDTANKIRIIMLNCLWCEMSYNEDGTAAFDRMHYFGYGQPQLDWLASTALNVESDWTIFVGTHVPPLDMQRGESYQEYRTKWTRDIELLRGILTAYENKTTYSGSYTKNTSRGEGDWANVSVSVDFTSALGRIAGFYCGHCHVDTINTTDLPFPVITITADGNIPYDSAEESRVMGTDNEHAIDFVTINKATQAVTLTRLGVGASRAYSYKGVVLYAITNALTNVSTSNGAASAEENTAYTATLTVNDGYEKLTVTVKMGGVDITSTAYNNGVVSIAEVTGDIVITASATKKANYTNLADPSNADWRNDTRLGSDNSYRENNPGCVVTNYIPCVAGDVIRIKGLNILDSTAGYLVVYADWGNGAGTKESVAKCESYPQHFTTDENGVISYRIYDISSTAEAGWGGKTRFSGRLTAASADGVIITVNEPIE